LRLGSIPLMPDDDFEGGSEPASGKAPINRNALRCSFCGKVYAEVKTMVCGPTPLVAICNECVELVTEIMREERGGPTQAAKHLRGEAAGPGWRSETNRPANARPDHNEQDQQHDQSQDDGGNLSNASPPVLWLLAVIPGTLIAVAAVTAIPARIGAHRSVAEVLRAE
jgi:phage FluMu protein Com